MGELVFRMAQLAAFMFGFALGCVAGTLITSLLAARER